MSCSVQLVGRHDAMRSRRRRGRALASNNMLPQCATAAEAGDTSHVQSAGDAEGRPKGDMAGLVQDVEWQE
eukprot:2700440-Pleurochrysis_carterae.AAC.1